MSVTIPLGSEQRVSALYSYPNSPTLGWTLAQTVQHWFEMTLGRDGLLSQGARCNVSVGVQGVQLQLDGPAALQKQLQQYSTRLLQFLLNGEQALTNVVPQLQKSGTWDPSPDKPKPGQPPYNPWRFFLPHGMAMLNQKALLFFHYPPIRLLETNQDYLDDPVPVRCSELLSANGVVVSDLPLFNTVMDATPIGAEDDQGSKKGPGIDPKWGVIPIQRFHDYQKSQVCLLLNPSPKHPHFTVPIVVYGAHPLATFNTLYGLKLKNNQVTVAEIIPGLKTPVMASTHPYVFYGTAQGFNAIGSGKLVNLKGATAQMVNDLVVAGWQTAMSADPTQDPQEVLAACLSHWKGAEQQATISALVQHQGSLKYSDPTTLSFEYLVPLPTPTRSLSPMLASPALYRTKETPVKKAPAQKAPAQKAPAQKAPAQKAPAQKAPVKKAPVKSARAAPPPSDARSTPVKSQTSLNVIGDSGKPVDWWFMYKVSAESETTDGSSVTGGEYLYFDSTMAGRKKAQLVLSQNRIQKNQGALHDTLSPLFSLEARQNQNLGWYGYNDEDQIVTTINKKTNKPVHKGTGPSNRGHCKGVLVFDLASQTGFWLVHSVPLFPLTAKYAYPKSGLQMAQTYLCIALDADTTRHIAQLMFDAHGPNVNIASDLLSKSAKKPNGFKPSQLPKSKVSTTLETDDPRLKLMQDLNGSTQKPKPYPPLNESFLKHPYPGRVPFQSRGGQKFIAIAKNRAWGLDFYNDLVGVVLAEDLEVETWENAGKKIPKSQKKGETHKVENMQSVNLAPLGLPYSWSEAVDHAKLALSDRTNASGTARWVCVGDINFTDAQEQRGGGTVAFQCPTLWQSLVQVLSDQPEPPRTKRATQSQKSKQVDKKTQAATKAPTQQAAKSSPKSSQKSTRPSTVTKQTPAKRSLQGTNDKQKRKP